MIEYFRIMFTHLDVMNGNDWRKWYKYSNITFSILVLSTILVWIMVLII